MPLDDPWGLPTTPTGFLNSSLTSRLDKIREGQICSSDSALESILQDWRADRTASLPDAFIYPLRRDPAKLGRDLQPNPDLDEEREEEDFSGLNALWEIESHSGSAHPSLNMGSLDERGLAVVRALKRLMSYKELVIFLIEYDQARSDHGQQGLDYLDLMGRPRLVNFKMPCLDILSSSHRGCDVAIVICRTDVLVGNLLTTIEDEERQSHRDHILCYLIHCAAEKPSHETLSGVREAIKHGSVDVGTHVVDKLLVCSLLLNDWVMFNAVASSYASEPSMKLFRVLKSASKSTCMPMEDFDSGFEDLLNKLFASPRLPDALLALETPEQVKSNPDGLIATWINNHFHQIETGTCLRAGLLGFQEAGAVIRICVEYQDGFNSTKQLHTMFAARANNGRFCLGLVLHIFAHLDVGTISPRTAQSWYQCFRHHGLAHIRLSDIIGITEFSRDGIAGGKSGRDMVDNTREIPDCKPIQRGEAGSMFAYMVQLGWYKESVEFLTEFVLRKLRPDDPGFNAAVFESLWVPFFVEAFSFYQRPGDQNWRQIYPVLRDTCLAVLSVYVVCVVGREPGKGSLRRARLSSRCVCGSCQAVNAFLVDETKTRQLFKVNKKKNSAARNLTRWWETEHSTITVSRPALGHIVHQLDDADRDCAWHIRETKAAGPVLFLQKRDNARQWRSWNDRREVAKEKMRQLGQIVGKGHVGAWESLTFLEKDSPTELLIPFVMDNAKFEARTLTSIRQTFREQLALLRQARGLTWKTITVSPEGLTIIWP